MKTIVLNGTELRVKDYYCNPCGDFFETLGAEEYLKNENPRLWLYVFITNQCNANCPFCVNRTHTDGAVINLARFEEAIRLAAPYIGGVSFTGGEPMLFPELLEKAVAIAGTYLADDIEFDMVTNGTNLRHLSHLAGLERFSAIHISRHAVEDRVQMRLMQFEDAPSQAEIGSFVSALRDPGAVVLNCVLQKNGVASCAEAAAYLDMAIDCGVRNTSFITMIQATPYCGEAYVSPLAFPFVSDSGMTEWNRTHDSRFTVWNRMHDFAYCHCISGDYQNSAGRTGFYLRCPGIDRSPDYCRQLVYTATNLLQDGFGSDRVILM